MDDSATCGGPLTVVTATATACSATSVAPVPAFVATTVNAYDGLVAKTGAERSVTAPVAGSIRTSAASPTPALIEYETARLAGVPSASVTTAV